MTQPEVLKAYRDIEEWWGGPLNSELIDLVAGAPWDQLCEAGRHWMRNFDVEGPGQLPEVAAGELRPVFGRHTSGSTHPQTAARLLLYTDSVVEDAKWLDPFGQVLVRKINQGEQVVRAEVLNRLRWLHAMRPLVEDGAIWFTHKYARGDSEWEEQHIFSPKSAPPLIDRNRSLSDRSVEDRLAIDLLCNIDVAREGSGTCLALSPAEEAAYIRLLDGKVLADNRISHLTALARIHLGDFGYNIESLVTLRKSSDALAEWRTQLRTGLAAVGEVPDTEEGTRQARSILAHELRSSAAKLEKAAKASPAMEAMRSGTRALGLTGLGAAAGAAAASSMGMPLAGAVAGAVTAGTKNIAESALTYLAAARERKKASAVWDIVMSFTETRTTQ